MPTIRDFGRCRIVIYFLDHGPPHFHVILKDGRQCTFAIADLARLSGEAPDREIRSALDWAAENREVLAAKWKEFN